MTAKTSPDWLPAGWTLQFKVQKTGRRITHYINLATGQKFFTKDDLIRYTKTGSTKCDDLQPTPRQTKMPPANGRVDTAVNANERPEWLPKNWFMELKTRKSGVRAGKHYKIYIDPSTGSRFYSKLQVFRFLNHVEQKSSKPKQKKRVSHSTSKIVVKANEHPEWLPKNWFTELKTYKSGAKIGKSYKIYVDPSTGLRFHSKPEVFRFLDKGDLYYTDPASGYVFRSKKDVLRYLETGEIGRYAFLPKKKHSDDQNLIHTEKSQLPAAKRQKVKHPGTRRQLFTARETSDRSILSHLEAETFEKGQSEKDYTETRLATTSLPQSQSYMEVIATAEKSNWSCSVAPKASNRNQGKTVSADDMFVSTAAANVLQVKNLLERGTEKKSNINSKDSGKSKNKKEPDLPRRFSKRLAHHEPDLASCGLELVKACQKEANGQCVLEDEATEQHNIGSGAEVAKQVSADLTVKSHWGSMKKTIKPAEDKDVLGKQPQMLENEKTSDTKSEVQPFVCSDPCLEFAIKTLTGAIPLQAASSKELVSTAASNVLQEKNLGKTTMGNKSSNIETRNSSKLKKMKELDLPRRSSKRLAGLEPELVASGGSIEVAVQNATTISGKNEPKSPCLLVDKATQQPNVGPNAELPYQASAAAVNQEISSRRPHEGGAILGVRPQMLGSQKCSDSKSELQPFFCSDPCLEFAIKTLTGAIPLEDAINEGLVSTPIANIQQQINLAEARIEHSRCRKALFNSSRSKKDCSFPHWSLKQLAGRAPELEASSLSNERVLKTAARKSCNNKAIRNVDLTSENPIDKASQELETGPRPALQHPDFTYRTTVFQVESSNKSKAPHLNLTAPTEMNIEKPGLHSAIPFGKSWSDSRFEFAFNTVTGSSPTEDSFAFQSYFHQQFSSSGSQIDGNFALPDYGLPSISQSDISPHLAATAQLVMQQQFPVNPSFLPPGNVRLPSHSGVDAQRPYSKGNKELPGKVKP
ncbi:uncharacterized protein LOC110421134 [Herrania umbratica]|uniref:Uncharacterized protein LOC110421134 n=1 Tax=Herrania umbratica TaxID=108875 RepID=A0A6J1ASX7_9ROSI|nr:uncharacterized protein LOC110421134 [Herrania umbratica]